MLRLLGLALLGLSVLFSHCEALSDSRLFLQFVQKYHKTYTAADFPIRFRNFQDSLRRVSTENELSKIIGGATYAVTKFADMSPEEFKHTVLMKSATRFVRQEGVPTLVPKVSFDQLPTAFDWRDSGAVTPVKDQEQCGSCWAFSATENIESVEILAGKGSNTTTNLSPQQIVDCDTSDQGCNGGRTETAFDYVIKAGGLEGIDHYPYNGVDQQCQFQSQYVEASISSWKYATEHDSETTLQQNLVSWSPLSICVDASKWQDYQSGVMTRVECGIVNVLDHCVQLVGYETQAPKPYWIVRNSWNTNWGIQGYIWLAMGDDVCGLAHDATTAAV